MKENLGLSNVAIFTNFHDFNPGYSLSGIVVDQALTLLRHGHKVAIYTNEQYNPKYNDDARITALLEKYQDLFTIHNKTKFMHLTDYKTIANVSEEHINASNEAANIFANDIMEFEFDAIYTHDFVFTGWNVPYSIAVKKTSRILDKQGYKCKWFHWIHSVPSVGSDWWQLNEYGKNHFLVFPNQTEIKRVADMYRTTPSSVRVIPHIKDPRTYYDFGEDAMLFTDMYPKIMSAEIVQVYPTSSDRMSAKQLDIVIRIFGNIKKAGISVFLAVANQWATGLQPRQNIKEYIKLAKEVGLTPNDDFVFTSEISTYSYGNTEDEIVKPYELGIPRKMLRELQLLSSVFIFPTVEESFGLVGPEAALSGALCITNRSLTMMFEVMGNYCPAYDFGSHHQNHPQSKDDEYLGAVAASIIDRLFRNEAIRTKMRCKQRYNMDYLYNRYYFPITLT